MEDDDDTAVIERPPNRERQVGPSEPQQPNGWRCEGCERRSMNRNDLCHPVPA